MNQNRGHGGVFSGNAFYSETALPRGEIIAFLGTATIGLTAVTLNALVGLVFFAGKDVVDAAAHKIAAYAAAAHV